MFKIFRNRKKHNNTYVDRNHIRRYKDSDRKVHNWK